MPPANIVDKAVTDASGAYSLGAAIAGAYTVSAIKPHYVTMPGPRTAVLAVDDTVTLADFVASPGGTITGVVKDATTGIPICNAVVQTGGVSQDVNSAMVTDATGTYSLPGTGCGGIEVYADAVDYTGRVLLVVGGGGGSVTKTILLTPAVEPFSYNGEHGRPCADVAPSSVDYDREYPPDCIDWSASPVAKTGLQSLFYCMNDTATMDSITPASTRSPRHLRSTGITSTSAPRLILK